MSKDPKLAPQPIGRIPTTVLALVNAGKQRRPSRQVGTTFSDLFADLETVADQFRQGFRSGLVPESDLESLRQVQISLQFVLALWERRDHQFRAALETLNHFAARCHWTRVLKEDGTLAEEPVGSLAALVSARCVIELSQCDLTRLKTCGWPPCELVFYDTTRNRSVKWHAEDPCGWRARAARTRSNKTG
jgi:hypothetical protein